MAISAPSRHGKVVNFGGVFFGFSLHHLFMHMNLFGRHLALHHFGALQRVFFGLWQCSGTHRMGRWSLEGLWDVLEHIACENCKRSRVRVLEHGVYRTIAFKTFTSFFSNFCISPFYFFFWKRVQSRGIRKAGADLLVSSWQCNLQEWMEHVVHSVYIRIWCHLNMYYI